MYTYKIKIQDRLGYEITIFVGSKYGDAEGDIKIELEELDLSVKEIVRMVQ